jgi:hypothetical protein
MSWGHKRTLIGDTGMPAKFQKADIAMCPHSHFDDLFQWDDCGDVDFD